MGSLLCVLWLLLEVDIGAKVFNPQCVWVGGLVALFSVHPSRVSKMADFQPQLYMYENEPRGASPFLNLAIVTRS